MNIAHMIDHTLLKADATKAQILELTEEAKLYKFAAVCVNPVWVALAAEKLQGTNVKVCTVIGFPLGADTTKSKAFAAREAVENGAGEIDMVINIGALKAGESEFVLNDMRAVVESVPDKALVKVIIETCLLTEEEKITATKLVIKAGADFVKTSTGFSTGGATTQDVALLRKTAGPDFGVKASGGIRSLSAAKELIAAGASRIGTSSGVKFILGE